MAGILDSLSRRPADEGATVGTLAVLSGARVAQRLGQGPGEAAHDAREVVLVNAPARLRRVAGCEDGGPQVDALRLEAEARPSVKRGHGGDEELLPPKLGVPHMAPRAVQREVALLARADAQLGTLGGCSTIVCQLSLWLLVSRS